MSWDKLWWQKKSVFFRLSIVLRFFFFLSQALPPCLPVPPSYSSTRLDNSDFCEQQRHYLYVQCPANVWFLDCRSSRAILSHQTSTPITQFHPAAMEALFRWYTGLLFSDRLFLLAFLVLRVFLFVSPFCCISFLFYSHIIFAPVPQSKTFPQNCGTLCKFDWTPILDLGKKLAILSQSASP